jgi:hypothetical protein
MSFSSLGLCDERLKTVAEQGYTKHHGYRLKLFSRCLVNVMLWRVNR